MKNMNRIGLLILGIVIAAAAVADTKISALPGAAAITGAELVPVVQSGATVRTTIGGITNYTETQLTNTFIVGLFTGCSGVQYLGADGVCHSSLTVGGTTNSAQYNAGSGALGGITLSNDQLLQGVTSAAPQAVSVTNCGDASHALAYSTSTHLFTCQSITSGVTPAGATGAVQYNNSGALGGLALATDQLLQGVTSGIPIAVAVPNCGSATSALSYSTTTHLFGCQSIPGPSTPYAVTSGGTGVATLTSHGLLLGEGTGNVSAIPAAALDTVIMGQGATTDPSAVAVTNCGDATHALSYNTSTHAWGCQAISASSGTAITQVFKTSATNRSNTTTPTADPDLQGTVGTGNHIFRCFITAAGAVSSGGLRLQPAFSGTITGGAASWSYTVTRYATTTAPTTVNQMQAASASVSDPTPVANDTAITLLNWSFVSSTSGTLSLNWAQQTSSGGNMTVNQGSYCWMTG